MTQGEGLYILPTFLALPFAQDPPGLSFSQGHWVARGGVARSGVARGLVARGEVARGKVARGGVTRVR